MYIPGKNTFLSGYRCQILFLAMAYNIKRKGDRGLFVFRFQVTGSDFLLCIEINEDSNSHPMLQKGVFRCSRGCIIIIIIITLFTVGKEIL